MKNEVGMRRADSGLILDARSWKQGWARSCKRRLRYRNAHLRLGGIFRISCRSPILLPINEILVFLKYSGIAAGETGNGNIHQSVTGERQDSGRRKTGLLYLRLSKFSEITFIACNIRNYVPFKACAF